MRPVPHAVEQALFDALNEALPDGGTRYELTGRRLDEARCWVPTFTGRRFYLLDPRPEDVAIEDIAESLARVQRFGGHTRVPYSVAEHSVHVSTLVPTLAALLHDASEAYVGDMVYPLKQMLPDYKAIEKRIQEAIAERFGIETFCVPEIKHADLVALATERRDLMAGPSNEWRPLPDPDPSKIRPCDSPAEARRQFMDRFNRMTNCRPYKGKPAPSTNPRPYKGTGQASRQPFRSVK